MALPLLLDDALVTAPFVHPLRARWVSPDPPTTPRRNLKAVEVGNQQIALVPAAEVLRLQTTHRVVPEVAVVAGMTGAVSMRCPVRPDEIGQTPVRLWDVSGTAELLARATLTRFYGIAPTAWTRDDDPDAQVVIVEGAEALRPAEAGLSEDLCRAWFILTGQPLASHVLVAPLVLERAELEPALATLRALLAAADERRRDLRRAVARAAGLPTEAVTALLSPQSYALDDAARRSLLALLQRGAPGSDYPPPQEIQFLPAAPDAADAAPTE